MLFRTTDTPKPWKKINLNHVRTTFRTTDTPKPCKKINLIKIKFDKGLWLEYKKKPVQSTIRKLTT